MKTLRIYRHRQSRQPGRSSPKVLFNQDILVFEESPAKSELRKPRQKQDRQDKQFSLTTSNFVITRRDNTIQRQRLLEGLIPNGYGSNKTVLSETDRTRVPSRVYTSPIHSHRHNLINLNFFRAPRSKIPRQSDTRAVQVRRGHKTLNVSPQPKSEIQVNGKPKVRLTIADLHYDREYEKLLLEYNTKYFSEEKKVFTFERPSRKRLRVKAIVNRAMDIAPWDDNPEDS